MQQSNTAQLVAQHIEQLQAMEGTWRLEIRDLAEKQRNEFRSAVLNYEAAPPTKESVLSTSPSNISPTGSASSVNAPPSNASLSSRAVALFQRQQKPKAPADLNSPQKKSMAESFSVCVVPIKVE